MPTAPQSFITAIDVACGSQPGAIAVDLQRPQRDLGAERGRLGVDAVRAADHHGVAMLVSARSIRRRRAARPTRRCSRSAASRHLPAQRGVADVGRREPVVDPLAGSGCRGGDRRPGRRRRTRRRRGRSPPRVPGWPATNASSATGASSRHAVGVGRRDDTERGVRLGGEQFDLEPATELRDVRPDRRHLRRRIARDHRDLGGPDAGSRRVRRRRPTTLTGTPTCRSTSVEERLRRGRQRTRLAGRRTGRHFQPGSVSYTGSTAASTSERSG